MFCKNLERICVGEGLIEPGPVWECIFKSIFASHNNGGNRRSRTPVSPRTTSETVNEILHA